MAERSRGLIRHISRNLSEGADEKHVTIRIGPLSNRSLERSRYTNPFSTWQSVLTQLIILYVSPGHNL
jgi:hypothetical protein